MSVKYLQNVLAMLFESVMFFSVYTNMIGKINYLLVVISFCHPNVFNNTILFTTCRSPCVYTH